MKTLTSIFLQATLFILLLSVPQTALADSKQIEELLQQRVEILEEALRLTRLRFTAGVGDDSNDFGWLIPEILEVRLKIIDMSEISNSERERLRAFEDAYDETLQTEKNAKLRERAGLGTRHDSLLAEIWRLDMETRLARERKEILKQK